MYLDLWARGGQKRAHAHAMSPQVSFKNYLIYEEVLRDIERRTLKYGYGNENHDDHHQAGEGADPTTGTGTGIFPGYTYGGASTSVTTSTWTYPTSPGTYPTWTYPTTALPLPIPEAPFYETSDQPLCGWKGMLIDEMGFLYSPQTGEKHAIRRAAKAACASYGTLVSTSTSGWYSSGELHQSPYETCNCGFHTSIDVNEALKYAQNVPDGRWPALVEMWVWGKTVVNDSGYRSEFIYPKEIRIIDRGKGDPSRIALRAQRLYGVPAFVCDTNDLLDEQVEQELKKLREKGE